MASPSSSKPYSLQLAERINGTTHKDQLGNICLGGFFLESVWHSVVETRFLKTPPPVARKAMLRAAIFWPGVYVATEAALKWAEWRVKKAEEERLENVKAS
ncbi:hypothetical protein F4820DRAFT_232387 [Hypoxylon rubiginosum]|uniref:Uncharacterized protein n=1 Tax=Hypoxylon rubiginosum TaxID=110542 RepID=A0ACB9Z5I1_9PEZI|nr:hypothetical protein F4820DRAFT_232387 [Hypoxylon rubiginosum]